MSYQPAPVPQPSYQPAPTLPPRHALGLPAGSVRAILALSVLGLLWLLVLKPLPEKGEQLGKLQLPSAFMNLQILMVLILAHYFAAHGHSIRAHPSQRSPLGLPRGTVRFLLLAGYLGLAVYLYRTQPEFEYPPSSAVILLLVLISGFFLGHLLTAAVRVVSGGVLPYWFQDIEAWVALLAMICMGVLFIILLFINPSLSLGNEIPLPTLEAILAALVGFYFGARS